MTITATGPLSPDTGTVPVFPLSMFDPVHLGGEEYGEQIRVNLAERNMLLGGQPGAGRYSGLNLITAHGALSHDHRMSQSHTLNGQHSPLHQGRAAGPDAVKNPLNLVSRRQDPG